MPPVRNPVRKHSRRLNSFDRGFAPEPGECRPPPVSTAGFSCPPNSSAPLEDGIAHYIEHLEKNGRPASTIAAYRSDLNQFALFVHPRTADASLGSIGRELVGEFLCEQERRNRTATAQRKLSAVKSLFRFLRRCGAREDDPAAGLRVQSPPQPAGRRLVKKALAEAIEKTPADSFSSARNRAIVEILYSGGLRLGELVSLNLTSLEIESRVVKVGRPDARRLVPVGSRAAAAIGKYLLFRADLLVDKKIADIDAGALFLNTSGKRLHRRTVQRIVERLLSSMNGGSPRALRRACADHMLGAGADAVAVAEMLGRRTPASAIASTEDQEVLHGLRIAYAASHPRNH